MRGMTTLLGALALAAWAATAHGQDLQRNQFKVAGSSSDLAVWLTIEKPLWTDELPKLSGGALTATAVSVSELGLDGAAVMRLLKLGQLDFAHASPAYVAGDAWLEAAGIAGVARDRDLARKVTTVWAPRLDDRMDKDHNTRILNWYALPAQMIFCRTPVTSLADLKDRKVRVQETAQADLVEGLGALAVVLPFADTASALRRGIVDCGIAGALAAHKAGWHAVVSHVIEMPVDYPVRFTAVGMTTWRSLNGRTRDFLSARMAALEDKAWTMARDEAAMGLVCMSGLGGTCDAGKPGKVIKVQPTAADLRLRVTAVRETVLKRWAKRCGAECVRAWNDTVGRMASVTAAP